MPCPDGWYKISGLLAALSTTLLNLLAVLMEKSGWEVKNSILSKEAVEPAWIFRLVEPRPWTAVTGRAAYDAAVPADGEIGMRGQEFDSLQGRRRTSLNVPTG